MANLMSYFQKGFEDGYKNADEIQRNSIARAAAQLGLNELHDAYLINSNLIPERHLQAKTKIEADTIDDLYRAKSTVATMPYKDAQTISQAQNEIGKNQLETEIRNNTWNTQVGTGVREANANYHLAGSGEILAGAQYNTNNNNRGTVQAISDNQLGTSYKISQTDNVQAQSGLVDAQTQQAATIINQQIAPMNEEQQLAHLSRILTSGVYSEKQKQGAAFVLAQIKEKKEQAAAELLKAGAKVGKTPEQIAAENQFLMRLNLNTEAVAAELGVRIQQNADGSYILQGPTVIKDAVDANGKPTKIRVESRPYKVPNIIVARAEIAGMAGVSSDVWNQIMKQSYNTSPDVISILYGNALGGGK